MTKSRNWTSDLETGPVVAMPPSQFAPNARVHSRSTNGASPCVRSASALPTRSLFVSGNGLDPQSLLFRSTRLLGGELCDVPPRGAQRVVVERFLRPTLPVAHRVEDVSK